MPILVEPKSFRHQKGIGASQVASVLHLSPFESAWQLWKRKSGREPKPPQTDAMLFGLSMESRAMRAYYRDKGINRMDEQVAAVHPKYPWLRCIVDGWNGVTGVNVKVTQSQRIIDMAEGDFESEWDDEADIEFAAAGRIPRNYMVQLACEMAVFEAEAWDYCVYDADTDSTWIVPMTWKIFWDWGKSEGEAISLREYWEVTAIPTLERFMQHLESGKEWEDRPETPMPDAAEWQQVASRYKQLGSDIKNLEAEKAFEKSKLITMMGIRSQVAVGGYSAKDSLIKGSFGLKIAVEDAESLARVKKAIAPLENAEGVKEIKEANREPFRRLDVRPISAKQVNKNELPMPSAVSTI